MDQHYVALDVSQQTSAVCILNAAGRVVIEASGFCRLHPNPCIFLCQG